MFSRLLSCLIIVAALAGGPALAQTVAPAVAPAAAPAVAPAKAGPAVAPALTADQARQAIETLENDARRREVINALRAITAAGAAKAPAPTAAPAATDGAAKPAAPAAATPAAAGAAKGAEAPNAEVPAAPAPDAPAADAVAPKPEAKESVAAIPLTKDSLLAELVTSASKQLSAITRDVGDVANSVTLFPVVWSWLVWTLQDPATFQLFFDLSWKLLIVFGSAFAAEWGVALLVRRPLAAIENRIPFIARAPAHVVDELDPKNKPLVDPKDAPASKKRRLNLTRIWQAIIRLPFVVAHFLLELLPISVFAITSLLLLSTQLGDAGVTRLAIEYVVNAYIAFRILISLMRALFGPYSLFAVREETAAYIELWTRRIVAVSVLGLAIANIATLLGLQRAGYLALIRLTMLVAHVLLVMVILQCRRQVASVIRAKGKQTGMAGALRSRFANLWHVFAIAIVMGLWAVWAFSVRDGYTLVLQYVVGTIIVALGTRVVSMVVLGLMDRAFQIKPALAAKVPGLEQRANLYLPVMRRIVSILITVIGVIVLLQLWGVNTLSWFTSGQIGGRLASAFLTVGIAAAFAIAVWEGVNGVMDRKLDGLSRDGHYARAARLRTFRPMIRTSLFAVIIAIVVLTTLSEIGVNVAPLLAGAGILGIAIGFGSQKLVQDLITGLFLLIENVVQVGDSVTVSGLSGVVENVSIRTIRLRAGDGAVHVVPFSAVTTITNASRGAGNAVIRVDVDYREDTDRVGAILKEIAKAMRSEPDFESRMRSEFELWGVDKIEGSLVQIAGQIRCTDSGKSPVLREFNRRMKLRFEEEGITLASAGSTTIVLQQEVERSTATEQQARPRIAKSTAQA